MNSEATYGLRPWFKEPYSDKGVLRPCSKQAMEPGATARWLMDLIVYMKCKKALSIFRPMAKGDYNDPKVILKNVVSWEKKYSCKQDMFQHIAQIRARLLLND